jgi:hypothetical protein
MMILDEIISSIASLPTEDRDYLFEFLRKQHIENRQAEILANAQEVRKAFKNAIAKSGNVDDLIADEPDPEGFWDMTLRFREKMRQENITFTDEDFADLRDRSPGREVNL